MKEKIYNLAPNFIQNALISFFNFLSYKSRYGGKYHYYLKLFEKNRSLSRKELMAIQKERFKKFIAITVERSEFYQKAYSRILYSKDLYQIQQLPIIDKEILRRNFDKIVIKSKDKLIKSKTGGTTGKSLEVKFLEDNMQERFAMLDNFRSKFGYKLGKKTAWFSGKNLLTKRDIKKNRFWKTDYLYKVRYYSTFHIKNDYLHYYIEDLIKFKPKYLVGFPSTILDIAKYGIAQGIDFPLNTIKAIFPTAETLTVEMRSSIEGFFKTQMYDQYASSEGAPWIFECEKGKLHLELQSGVFEVLDENDQPSESGRLIVTSFTTEGTPLIRYDIGDSIILDNPNKICSCGNNNPMVLQILGRMDDFIYSPETGKINLGNISNTLKDTKGIQTFQVIQNSLDSLEIYLVIDKTLFNDKVKHSFLKNWRDRVGNRMKLNLHYVNDIPVENSGKFRMVKNNIKHLIT